MAITKIKKITTRLDRTVNYALNNEKTDLNNAVDYVLNNYKTSDEQVLYESAINCSVKTAFTDMNDTKKAFRNTGGILGYHIMQSFKPNETTPATAHEIGVKLALECFDDKYEVVIGTHLDRQHLHNHIIVNSVSFIDGKKYRNKISNYFDDIRGTSDKLCREYGLSVITPQAEKRALTYSEWLARNKGKMSWQSLIRMDMDDAIKQAFNYGNFLMLMESKGYMIKQGKYLAVRPYGKERFSRTYKLGDGYDVESIKAKIFGKDLRKGLIPTKTRYKEYEELYQKGKAKGFQALILHYMYILGMIKQNEAPEKVSKLFREDLIKFDEITKTFDFLKDRNLDTEEDISNYKIKCEKTIKSLKQEKNSYMQSFEDKKVLFSALIGYKTYKKAHELYHEGCVSMEAESQKYKAAERVLNNKGYVKPNMLKELECEYSYYLDSVFKYDINIKQLKKESRMCDSVIINCRRIENNIDQLLDQHREHNKAIEYGIE